MTKIGVAFPKHEADRQRLRALKPGAPLPAIYADGVDRPCADCGLLLNVGPRLAATGVPVICPLCVVRRGGGDIVHLGNPDSKPE